MVQTIAVFYERYYKIIFKNLQEILIKLNSLKQSSVTVPIFRPKPNFNGNQ